MLDGPLPPQTGRRYAVGVDLGFKRDASVAAVCHAEPVTRVQPGDSHATTVGARIVLDRMHVWSGTRAHQVELADVEEWVAEAARAYNYAEVVIDPFQAVGMAQRLRATGHVVTEFNFTAQSVGRIAANLHRLLRERLLSLPDDENLLDELANVRLRETSPGVVRLDHDADRHDDRAVALALASMPLLEQMPVTHTVSPQSAYVCWSPATSSPTTASGRWSGSATSFRRQRPAWAASQRQTFGITCVLLSLGTELEDICPKLNATRRSAPWKR